MMARAKIIYILMSKVDKLFSLLSGRIYSALLIHLFVVKAEDHKVSLPSHRHMSRNTCVTLAIEFAKRGKMIYIQREIQL